MVVSDRNEGLIAYFRLIVRPIFYSERDGQWNAVVSKGGVADEDSPADRSYESVMKWLKINGDIGFSIKVRRCLPLQ